MKVVICDTNRKFSDCLRRELEQTEKCRQCVAALTSGQFEELVEQCGFCADIFLLDVDFGGKLNGVRHTAHRIHRRFPQAQIVFMTDGGEGDLHCLYEAPHCYAFKKDDYKTQLSAALERACSNIRSGRKTLALVGRGSDAVVECDDIRFIERSGHSTILRLRENTMRAKAKLDELLLRLPDSQFVRCHESYIANLLHVRELTGKSVVLKNGDEVPMSRQYRPCVRCRLLRFTGGDI